MADVCCESGILEKSHPGATVTGRMLTGTPAILRQLPDHDHMKRYCTTDGLKEKGSRKLGASRMRGGLRGCGDPGEPWVDALDVFCSCHELSCAVERAGYSPSHPETERLAFLVCR